MAPPGIPRRYPGRYRTVYSRPLVYIEVLVMPERAVLPGVQPGYCPFMVILEHRARLPLFLFS